MVYRRGSIEPRTLITLLAVIALLVGGLIYVRVSGLWQAGPATSENGAPTGPAAGSVEAGDPVWDAARAREELDTLAESLMGLSNRDEPLDGMITAARRLVERYPKFPEGRAFYGQVLMLSGDADGAIEQFNLSLDLNRQQAGTHLLLGTLYLQTDRPVEAAKAFDNAVGLDPTNASYRLHLAQAHLELDDHDKARREFLEVIRHAPEAHQAYAGLSDLYMRQNKPDLALNQLDRAIENVPENQSRIKTLYLRKKAMAFRRGNDPEAALLVLQSIPFDQRQSPAILEEMAVSWAMLGQPEKAADLYKTALAMDPLSTDLLAGAIRWYDKAGNTQQRDRFIRTMQRTDPDHPVLK